MAADLVMFDWSSTLRAGSTVEMLAESYAFVPGTVEVAGLVMATTGSVYQV